MIGVDIGSHSIKAVLLAKNGNTFKVEAVAVEPTPRGAVVDHEIQDIEPVGEALRRLVRRLPSKIKASAMAVAGSSVMTKVIFMDASLSDDEMMSQIEVEAENLIPHPLDEVNLDFERLRPHANDPSRVDVLLSAARSESVQARVSAMEIAGLDTHIMDIEAYALGRAVGTIAARQPELADAKLLGVLDIGARTTTLSIIEDGEVAYSREEAFGGEQLNQLIQSAYDMSADEAERVKLRGELPATAALEVLAPFQTELLQLLRRSLQLFYTSEGHDSLDGLVLTGGSAAIEGLADMLHEELGFPVLVADVFAGMKMGPDVNKRDMERHGPALAIASGLAMRSFS
ncbi:pilus assembly protein PilM [Gallaecimonas kandeliae]|uniref:pilus assembly protein PilM n=1 Tax=Gallaecimonas kandeliae TaxID=3029055 RepID=UPI002648E3BC|nr:pilus assembly protein PilM [Gallaecimonas kandeliae]WKE65287.1 pilus assembly protein PilM [Gallaecimonas kandeliae]